MGPAKLRLGTEESLLAILIKLHLGWFVNRLRKYLFIKDKFSKHQGYYYLLLLLRTMPER